jgi:GGDEF domain-containing protein
VTLLPSNVLQGTLALLILKSIGDAELHGLGISRRIEQITQGAFQVSPGSLFPLPPKKRAARSRLTTETHGELTCSIGVSVYWPATNSPDSPELRDILESADKALYAAKNSGAIAPV